MRTRTLIAGMIALPLNAVIFGAGAIVVLSIPALKPWWPYFIPVVVIAGILLTVPLAWRLAPHLRVSSDKYPQVFPINEKTASDERERSGTSPQHGRQHGDTRR